MTQLSITLAVATLTLSLAPAAQAYSVAPQEDEATLTHVTHLFAETQTEYGTCDLDVTPILATALDLPSFENMDGFDIALASCEAE